MGVDKMSKTNHEYIDYKEWELLLNSLTIDDISLPGKINGNIRKIEISRDNLYKIKAFIEGETTGFSNIRNDELKPGELIEGIELKVTKHSGLIQYILESCYIGGTNTTYNPYENKYIFIGDLITYQIKEICSNNKIDVHIDWFLNGPRQSFIFTRATERVVTKTFNKTRFSVDERDKGSANPFESVSSGCDFAFINTKEFKFIVSLVPKHYSPDWSEKIAIEYRNEWGIPSEETKRAISELVSFILGKQLLQVGSTKLDENENIVERCANSPWGDNVIAECQRFENNPIDLSHENLGGFERAMNQLLPKYLEVRDDLDLNNAFWKYWIAGNMPMGTNLPLLSAAVEGIAKNWFKLKKSKTKGVYMDSKTYKNLVGPEIEVITKKLLEVENGKKIINKINSSYNMGANDRINYFFEEINLTVGDAEKEALKARNSMAHGDATSPDETQKLINLTRIYETFFHRIILKLLGFEGNYIDRGTIGFPNRNIDEPSGEFEQKK